MQRLSMVGGGGAAAVGAGASSSVACISDGVKKTGDNNRRLWPQWLVTYNKQTSWVQANMYADDGGEQ